MNFWIERIIPLLPMPIPIKLNTERRAAIKAGRYTASVSRYLVRATLEDYEIQCWHPFRKPISSRSKAYKCLLCRCYMVPKEETDIDPRAKGKEGIYFGLGLVVFFLMWFVMYLIAFWIDGLR